MSGPFFAKQQQSFRPPGIQIKNLFFFKDKVAYFAIDKFFYFGDVAHEVFYVDVFAYQEKVNDFAVAAAGEVADKPGLLQTAEALQYVFNHLVNAGVFEQYVVYIVKQRVIGIGSEHFFVALGSAHQHTGIFEAVKLHTNAVGRLAEFSLEVAQPGLCGGVEEELNEKFDAGLGSY